MSKISPSRVRWYPFLLSFALFFGTHVGFLEAQETAAAAAVTASTTAPTPQEVERTVSALELIQAASLEASEYRTKLSTMTPDFAVGRTLKTTEEIQAAQDLLRAAQEFAVQHIGSLEEFGKLRDTLPPADPPQAFLEAKESIEGLYQRRKKEAELARDQAKRKDNPKALLDNRRAMFLGKQADILQSLLEELNTIWETAYPEEEARKAAEAKALLARSEAKRNQQAEAEEKARKHAAELEAKQREADELAQKARAELETAKSVEETQLAELRLTYAKLKSDAEAFKVKALQAEAAARKAEENLDTTRAEIAIKVPALSAPGIAPKAISTYRKKLSQNILKLRDLTKILQEEVEIQREEVPAIRSKYQDLAAQYDALEEGMGEFGSSRNYRQQVYFARLAQRQASEKLDQYRTFVEWRERRMLSWLRQIDAMQATLETLEPLAVVLYLGQTQKQWKQFFLFLFATLLASFLVSFLGGTIFKSFSARTKSTWDDIALEELTAPVRIAVFLFGLKLAVQILTPTPQLSKMLANAGYAARAAWFGFFAWRVSNIISRIAKPHVEKSDAKLDDQLFHFLRRGIRTAIVCVSLVFILESFGWKVTSLLAGLGIGGLAFALAAKDTLANLFGSIVLFMDRPFRVGNWVIIDGVEGVVEDIGIRSTRIRTFKDTVVTIPNASVANASAENVHSFRKRRLYFTMELRFDTPVDVIRQAVDRTRKILDDHPKVLPGHYVYVTGLKASGVEIMVYSFVSTRDWGEWLIHCQEIYLSTLSMLEEIGAGLAFPTQTIELEHIKSPPSGFSPPEPQ